MIEEKHSIVFKYLMPASVMPIAMLREWVCIVNCQKNYMHIFVSLIFCVCLHCPLQVSGGDCWLQSHPGTLVINQPSFCLPPHSLPLHLFLCSYLLFYAQTVCLPALQTWCTRSSVAYLSSRPVVVYCLKVLSTRL